MQIIQKDTTTETANEPVKSRIEEPAKSSHRRLDIGHFVIEEGDQEKQQIPKNERVRPKRTELTVRQREVEKKSSRYFRGLDVGRIVIEEIPEYKRDKQLAPTKLKVRPKSTEVTLIGQKFDEFQSKNIKENVGKVGKLDVTSFEKHQSEHGKVKETKERYTDWTHIHETKEKLLIASDEVTQTDEPKKAERMVMDNTQRQKEEIPKRKISEKEQIKSKSMERTLTQNEVDIRKKARYFKNLNAEYILIEDIPEEKKQVSKHDVLMKEKVEPDTIEVTVNQHETQKQKEVRPSYAKDHDVGRIIIEEIPKNKDEQQQVPQKDTIRPKSIEVALTGKDLKEISCEFVRKDAAKAKKLEVGRIVTEEIPADKHELSEREVVRKEKIDSKTTDVSFTPYKDKGQRKERHSYVKNLDVGRMIIEEVPGKKEYAPKGGDLKNEKLQQDTAEVTVSHHEAKEQREIRQRYAKDQDVGRIIEVDTNKIAVTIGNTISTEETEKQKYSKKQDVGRIVIKEMPKEKEGISKPHLSTKHEDRPTTTEATVIQKEIEEHPKTYATENIVNVGKLDVTMFGRSVPTMSYISLFHFQCMPPYTPAF